jgi:hypothetical protein
LDLYSAAAVDESYLFGVDDAMEDPAETLGLPQQLQSFQDGTVVQASVADVSADRAEDPTKQQKTKRGFSNLLKGYRGGGRSSKSSATTPSNSNQGSGSAKVATDASIMNTVASKGAQAARSKDAKCRGWR